MEQEYIVVYVEEGKLKRKNRRASCPEEAIEKVLGTEYNADDVLVFDGAPLWVSRM